MPSSSLGSFPSHFDLRLRECLSRILCYGISDSSWTQATLLFRLGGLGLRESERSAAPAFVGSCNSARTLVVGSILRNGTERNDGLNCGTECFLRLKLTAYYCCTSYQWHFQQVIKRTPRKIKRI